MNPAHIKYGSVRGSHGQLSASCTPLFSQLPKAGSNAAMQPVTMQSQLPANTPSPVASAKLHNLGISPPSQAYRDVHRRWRSHRRAHLLSIRHTGHVTADSSRKVVKSLQVLWQAWRPGLAEPLTLQAPVVGHLEKRLQPHSCSCCCSCSARLCCLLSASAFLPPHMLLVALLGRLPAGLPAWRCLPMSVELRCTLCAAGQHLQAATAWHPWHVLPAAVLPPLPLFGGN